MKVSVDRTNANGSNHSTTTPPTLMANPTPSQEWDLTGPISIAATLGASNTLSFELTKGGKTGWLRHFRGFG